MAINHKQLGTKMLKYMNENFITPSQLAKEMDVYESNVTAFINGMYSAIPVRSVTKMYDFFGEEAIEIDGVKSIKKRLLKERENHKAELTQIEKETKEKNAQISAARRATENRIKYDDFGYPIN